AACVVLSAVGLTAPTVLVKTVEFGALTLPLPCLLLALLLAERRRWAWFFAVWLAAVASRQSAAAWLALPAWHALAAPRAAGAERRWRTGSRASRGCSRIRRSRA